MKCWIKFRAFCRANPPLHCRRGFSSNSKKHYERRIMVHTMEECFDVVSDVKTYKDFVPWVKDSIIMKTVGSNYVEADLVVGFQLFNERYTSIVTMEKPKFVRAESHQTQLFEKLVSEWRFSPARDPKHCWVTFMVEFEFKNSLYNQVSEMFMKDIVNNMTKAFDEQCKRKYS